MRYILILIAFTGSFAIYYAQPQLKDLIKAQRFIFIATSMTSGKAGASLLNSPFDVTIKGDTIISYLPYKGIGRSTKPDAGNLMFTSYHVSYLSSVTKGGFKVNINISDQNESGKYAFSIAKNGTASLFVSSNLRDPATYEGYIKGL